MGKVVAGFPLVGGGTENIYYLLRKEVGSCCKAGIPFAHARRCCQLAEISADTDGLFTILFYHLFLNDRQNQTNKDSDA
jgi:hypothetical protein